MGGRRGRNGRTQRKHFKEDRENVWKRSKSDPQPGSTDDSAPNNGEDRSSPNWQPLPTHNATFDEYYKRQGIVTADEWDTFMDYLRKPLPSAFRINSSGQFCSDIRSQLEDDFVKTLQEEFTGEDEADAIRPLPWFLENLALVPVSTPMENGHQHRRYLHSVALASLDTEHQRYLHEGQETQSGHRVIDLHYSPASGECAFAIIDRDFSLPLREFPSR